MIKKTWEKLCGAGRWIKKKAKEVLIVLGILGIATAATITDLNRNEISLEKVQQKYEKSQLKDKYQLDGASLKRIAKDDPKDRIVVEIGDKEATEFIPKIKISRWDEVDFTITPNLEGVATKDKDLSFEGDKIKFKTPKIDYEFYEGENEYKFIWHLKEKPTSNIVEFQIESSGLDFFYQPPLNEEYPESLNCSPTECDTDGDDELDSFRPENIVGSYAVYHNGNPINYVDGKLYRTGKFGHIKRIKLIDANGLEDWGYLNISEPIEIIGDIEIRIYSVEIPEEFHSNAIYPIKSNDTFGYDPESHGASSQYYNPTSQVVVKFTGAVGEGISMSAYIHAYNSSYLGNYKEALFGISGDTYTTVITNGETNTGTTSATPGYHTQNFTSAPTLAAIEYGLGVMCANYTYYYWDSTGGVSKALASGVWGTWLTNVEFNPDYPYQLSFYVTYGEAGEEEEPEMQIIIIE